MHTLTLVSVAVPDCTADTPSSFENQMIREVMNELKSKHEAGNKDIMADIHYQRLHARQSQFGREAIAAVDDLMEPYSEQTEDPRYLEFHDRTETVIDEYENDSVDCIKSPDGRIKPAFQYRGLAIKDGKVVQEKAGQLRHEKRTKKSKKYTALPNYPFKKLFKSFGEYAEEYCGYIYDKARKRYGYYCNPYSFYDWYSIGGRWPFEFLVKNSCLEYSLGEWSFSDMEEAAVPDGYRWCSIARKKDIEWEACYEWRRSLATERFYAFEEMFKKGELDDSVPSYYALTENAIQSFGETIYVKGESVDEYLNRHGYDRKSKYHFSCGGLLLTNGQYHDSYEFCDENYNIKDGWQKMIDDFIDSLSDNDVLVAVDCHV